MSRLQYTHLYSDDALVMEHVKNLMNRVDTKIAENEIKGHIVGITGVDDIVVEMLIRSIGGIIGNKGMWEKEELFVIGQDGFDKNYIKTSVRIGLIIGSPFRYLGAPEFMRFLMFGEQPNYYKGDRRVRNHPGLSFLASLGFEWPSTYGVPGDNTGGEVADGWNNVSLLASKYGYSVRQGISDRERRDSLRLAIADTNDLGLQAVVEHIAFLVRINKGRWDDRMDAAIDRWEADLDWLYEKYYKNSIFSFVWPSY